MVVQRRLNFFMGHPPKVINFFWTPGRKTDPFQSSTRTTKLYISSGVVKALGGDLNFLGRLHF